MEGSRVPCGGVWGPLWRGLGSLVEGSRVLCGGVWGPLWRGLGSFVEGSGVPSGGSNTHLRGVPDYLLN